MKQVGWIQVRCMRGREPNVMVDEEGKF
jgi:hypothetical protein